MSLRRPTATEIGRVIRRARELGLETTGIVLQPDGAVELRTRPSEGGDASEEGVRDEIARHFGQR